MCLEVPLYDPTALESMRCKVDKMNYSLVLTIAQTSKNADRVTRSRSIHQLKVSSRAGEKDALT